MLRIPKIPAEAPQWVDFRCFLNGQPAQLHRARVSAMPYNTEWPGHQRPFDQTEECGFVSFEADEPVTVTVIADRDFEIPVVRPISKEIHLVKEGRKVTFTLTTNGAYSLELDDQHRCLTLLSNPPRDFGVSPEEKNVRYFGPGIHHPGIMELHSGETLYLDPEAIVYGVITAYGASDIRILGYGILDSSEMPRTGESCYPHFQKDETSASDEDEEIESFFPCDDPEILTLQEIRRQQEEGCCAYAMMQFWHGNHIEIDGPIFRDSPNFCGQFGLVDGLKINNVKLIGMWRYNSDGLDLINSRNARIENCFLRNFDDCLSFKGLDGFQTRSLENIVVKNCVLWCDWGAALEIGAETFAPSYSNILYENCDIIRSSMACMRIHHHNNAEIHHITYRKIRCEYARNHHSPEYQSDMTKPYSDLKPAAYPALFHLLIVHSHLFAWKHAYANGSIHDVRFEDIQVYLDDGVPMPAQILESLDGEHAIRNVDIQKISVKYNWYECQN